MNNKLIICIVILSGIVGFITSLYLHRDTVLATANSDVPIIQTFHYPATFVKQLAGDPKAGEKIFTEFCATCHAKQPKIDIHAPHIGDHEAWKMRSKLGMPMLLNITINGVGAMPARGGCFECSDEQLRETIRYMLNQK